MNARSSTGLPELNVSAVSAWLRIVAERDLAALADLLDDDVVLHSPVTPEPLVGKQAACLYLSGVFKVFFNPSFGYVREIVGTDIAVLEFEVEVDGLAVNGIDLLRWNDAGRIVEFKVMLRPLNTVNAVHQRMERMLQALRQK